MNSYETYIWNEGVVDQEVLDFDFGVRLVVDRVFNSWRYFRVVLFYGDLYMYRYSIRLGLVMFLSVDLDLTYVIEDYKELDLVEFVGLLSLPIVAVG